MATAAYVCVWGVFKTDSARTAEEEEGVLAAARRRAGRLIYTVDVF